MGLNSSLIHSLYQKRARLGKPQGFISKESAADDRTRFIIMQFKRYCKSPLPKIVTDWNFKILK